MLVGQNIQAGQNIGQINDLSDFKIEAKIDEHYIDRVRPGLIATINRDGKEYQLRVRKVYPEVRDGSFRTDFVFVSARPTQMRSGQTYYIGGSRQIVASHTYSTWNILPNHWRQLDIRARPLGQKGIPPKHKHCTTEPTIL